jgi:hypothetical protein
VQKELAERFKRLDWGNFSFRLVENWELTGHTLDPDDGRLEISDREHVVCTINWKKANRQPPFDLKHKKWFSTFVKNNKLSPNPKIEQLEMAQFLITYREEGDPFWASIYSEEAGVVLDILFESYSNKDENPAWVEFLESFQPNIAKDGWKKWAAWGLAVQLPENFQVIEILSYPAFIKATFEDEKHYKINLYRWGLPAELLRDHSISQFYRSVLKQRKAVIDEVLEWKCDEWDGAKISFRERGMKNMDKLLGLWWQGRGYCWHNQDEKRMYAIDSVCPKKIQQRQDVEALVREVYFLNAGIQ